MAYKFDSNWATGIGAITSSPEFQNATVRIIDVDARDASGYDVVTDTWTNTPATPLYEGQARVIPIRAGAQDANALQANPTTITAVRVQLPDLKSVANLPYGAEDFGGNPYDSAVWSRIRRGVKIIVLGAPYNPTLVNRIFTVTSDLQGSSAATRTLHALFDSDAVTDG